MTFSGKRRENRPFNVPMYDRIHRGLILKLAWKSLQVLKFSNSLTFPGFPGYIATLSQVKCQWCSRTGHSALHCFKLKNYQKFRNRERNLSYHKNWIYMFCFHTFVLAVFHELNIHIYYIEIFWKFKFFECSNFLNISLLQLSSLMFS